MLYQTLQELKLLPGGARSPYNEQIASKNGRLLLTFDRVSTPWRGHRNREGMRPTWEVRRPKAHPLP